MSYVSRYHQLRFEAAIKMIDFNQCYFVGLKDDGEPIYMIGYENSLAIESKFPDQYDKVQRYFNDVILQWLIRDYYTLRGEF